MKIKKPFSSWFVPFSEPLKVRWIAALQDPGWWAVVALIIYLLSGGRL